MNTIYTTKAGVQLEIGRIPRFLIDQLLVNYPEPEAPTRTEEIWGGFTEEVPDRDDPDYRFRLQIWYATIINEQTAVILPAVRVMGGVETVDLSELEQLQQAGILSDVQTADLLQYEVLKNNEDATAVTELVFYHSTVTQRGIDEATQAYRVTWFDQPVLAWKAPELPAQYTNLYRDRQSAQMAGYTWEQFCTMSGPEQSAIVAYHLISGRLEWLISKYRLKK